MGLIRPNTERVDPRFLLYAFLSPDFQETIRSRTIPGSTVERIALTEFPHFPIRVPALTEQQVIARLLGALDDKIELNRQMNGTLETMARLVFKSWFVDFDPVVTKAAGRKLSGMDATTTALFPDRFIDSDLGPIPEGWRTEALGRFVDLVAGKSYGSKDLQESTTALVTLKSFNRGGGFRPDGLKPYTGYFKRAQVLVPGEIIVARTDITQAAEVIGRAALVKGNPRYKTLVASLDVLIVRPQSDAVTVPFLYCLMRTPEYEDHIVGHANGTTVLHLSKEGVPSYRFVLPPNALVKRFSEIADALLEEVDLNEQECRSLSNLRDTLIPKLLSGEIRLRQAEKIIGEAI